MTPAELQLYADDYVQRMDDEMSEDHARIYVLSALIRAMVWARHAPPFERVFPDRPGAKEEMTDEEIYAQVRALNMALGGHEN